MPRRCYGRDSAVRCSPPSLVRPRQRECGGGIQESLFVATNFGANERTSEPIAFANGAAHGGGNVTRGGITSEALPRPIGLSKFSLLEPLDEDREGAVDDRRVVPAWIRMTQEILSETQFLQGSRANGHVQRVKIGCHEVNDRRVRILRRRTVHPGSQGSDDGFDLMLALVPRRFEELSVILGCQMRAEKCHGRQSDRPFLEQLQVVGNRREVRAAAMRA